MTRQTKPEEPPVSIDDCECIRATERAILCSIGDTGKELWIPQSLVQDESEVYRHGDTGTLVIPAWFARKNGLV